ncbi:MAG: uracil-xanthine permease [Clostridia bacterium]|nr:uracil-xanthine permease [Clostridia bacterium]
MNLVYNIKDKPKFGQTLLFALQQLLAIMAATIAVPAIVGHGMSSTAALFGAGVGTLVYLLFTKFRSPVFLGSSFAFLGSMAAAFAGGVSMYLGYLGLIIGACFAGLVYVVIALVVKLAGVKWINKLMPAIVIGPIVAIIGLSLAGNAIGDLTKGNVSTPVSIVEMHEITADDLIKKELNVVVGTTDAVVDPAVVEIAEKDIFDSLKEKDNVLVKKDVYVQNASPYLCLIVGLVTLAVTMLCSVYGKKMLKMIPFIVGILAGYAVAAIFTVIGISTKNPALMIIDFSKFQNLQIFAVPDFTFLTAYKGFGEISGAYILTILVAYVPVAFVVFAEHIADHKNLSTIVGVDLTEDPGLHRTLLGDGVGSFAGAIFGGCPNTTYGESIGCVAISGNASVITILYTAILAILISFIGPFAAFLASIPSCVMGGVCMALYGFIAVSGLKMIQKVDLNDNRNLFVVSVILIAGVGGLTVSFGAVNLTTVACALILGVLTNLILGGMKKKKESK